MVDNRLFALLLVKSGLTPATLFLANGQVAQAGIQIVHQGFNEFLQPVPFETDGVQDVDAQDAQVLHLAVVVRVIQAHVDDQVCLLYTSGGLGKPE